MTTDTPGTDVINNLYLYYTCYFYFVQHERTVTVENVKKIIPDQCSHQAAALRDSRKKN